MIKYEDQDEIDSFSSQWSCYKIMFPQGKKKATIGSFLSTDEKRKGFSNILQLCVLFHKSALLNSN